MKIEYLKLRNFANIYTAFKSHELTIDFTQCKNRIILLTGPNGSGKTSILSCLHPFATNGNLDVRNDNSLILIGENGYKEIHLLDDIDLYIIKHYYTPSKESHTVKSYIEKNGTELNPNGNVTSFKELVKEHLDIEMDYLKLTRLGSNVTNFIDLKTTDRKSFMGNILDDVDIYLKYFKKVTNSMRELKSVISHLVDKITKLSIEDPDDMMKRQEKLITQIENMERLISDQTGKLNIVDYEISKYDSPAVIKQSITEMEKEIIKVHKCLDSTGNRDVTIAEYDVMFNKANERLTSLESELLVASSEEENLLNSIDKDLIELSDIDRELSKIENSSDVKDLESMISNLKGSIEKRSVENKLASFSPSYTRKEVEDLIVMLDKSMEILYTTYEFGKEPIKKAIEFIVSKGDIEKYVETNTNKISRNKLQSLSEFVYNSLLKKLGNVRPSCKDSSGCQIMNFYNELYDLATEIPDSVVEDETFVTYTKLVYQNINSVLKNIQNYKTTFEKLPESIQRMFTLKNTLENIQGMTMIYDRTAMYDLMTVITEYELQQKDLTELTRLKEKLNLTKKSLGNSDYFLKKREELVDRINSLKEKLASSQEELSKLRSMVDDQKSKLTQLQTLKESIEKRDTIESDYKKLLESHETVNRLYSEKLERGETLERAMYDFNKLKKEYSDNDYKLKSYISMSEELNGYNQTYDEMELVKGSLSSKEGIPLLYIQIYLKNIQETTNELLELAYGDDLFVNDFNITAEEFKIPFNTKGTEISDVVYASQGEKSFISLALSFALIYQSISRYNIMLLDEIDSTLDTTNREKFLQILEKQMDMIDGEQIFLISHNNMFNMYPVDVIDTKNRKSKEIQLAHHVKINIE